MKEFRYLSYYTEYSCSGSYNLHMGVRACFRSAFDNVVNGSNIKYKIRLYPGIDFCKRASQSNACLFSKQEIRNHLLQLKDLFPFSYKVLDEIKEDKKIIAVHLHVKDVPAVSHKYILTWVRYLYEYPYNVILRDAYWLKEDPRFRFQSIANLFNVVASCCQAYVGGGHSIGEDYVHIPMTKAQLKRRIRGARFLNNIYDAANLDKKKLPEKIGKFSCLDSEYWSKELFGDSRKPIYVEMYNEVRKR